MARGLLKNSDHLLAFLKYAEVEPTSNAAEQSIRAAIQWRKICFGNQSKRGEVLTSRLLTITRTRFLQKKNVFRYLVDILNAHPTSLALLSLVAASGIRFPILEAKSCNAVFISAAVSTIGLAKFFIPMVLAGSTTVIDPFLHTSHLIYIPGIRLWFVGRSYSRSGLVWLLKYCSIINSSFSCNTSLEASAISVYKSGAIPKKTSSS